MKVILILPFFITPFFGVVFAQNSITINQQGNGNSATVNQSGEQSVHPCPKEFGEKLESGNIILMTNGSKTILEKSDSTTNTYNGILRKDNEIQAVQYGSLNLVSAFLSGSKNSLMLSQNGTANTISINPCSGSYPNTEAENNAVHIRQEGSGNSASISQQ